MIQEFDKKDLHTIAVALRSLATLKACEFIYDCHSAPIPNNDPENEKRASKRRGVLATVNDCLDDLRNCC